MYFFILKIKEEGVKAMHKPEVTKIIWLFSKAGVSDSSLEIQNLLEITKNFIVKMNDRTLCTYLWSVDRFQSPLALECFNFAIGKGRE